jgi:hypothetical protein
MREANKAVRNTECPQLTDGFIADLSSVLLCLVNWISHLDITNLNYPLKVVTSPLFLPTLGLEDINVFFMVSAQQLKYFRMPWKKSLLTCQDVEIYKMTSLYMEEIRKRMTSIFAECSKCLSNETFV